MNEEKIKNILKNIGSTCLVAATKYITSEEMKKLFSLGIKNFGENRVDSFIKKYDELSSLDVKWHFIGHLQRNKALKIINKIDVLHSLDSLFLASLIEKYRDRPLDVFVELKLTNNQLKSGVKEEDLPLFIEELKKYKKINVLGFMVMTDKDNTLEEKRIIFKKAKYLASLYSYKDLSMGMSDDYQIALEEGATYIRLGRILYLDN